MVSTPDENQIEHLWLIQFDVVLRLEYESLGIDSFQGFTVPVEIYDIYNDYFSAERSRWIKRLRLLGESEEQSKRILHIVLASSYVQGWGENEMLEGINIICRQVQIKPAPDEYKGMEWHRPRIEGQ